MSSPSDKALLQKIKQHPQYFAEVYDLHFKAIFGYIFRRLGQYEIARDITAETFLKAYQNIGWFQWRGISIAAWLYKIATNEINQYFRKAKYIPACIDDLGLSDILQYEPGIETEKQAIILQMKEYKDFRAIQLELLLLDTKYQEVIALRFFEEKTIKEIATILNKNEGTVKSLLSRGMKLLKVNVENNLSAGGKISSG